MLKGFLGTYTTGKSEGIYSFSLDELSGKMSNTTLFAKIKNPKYLTYYNNKLFTVYGDTKASGVAVYNGDGSLIDSISFEMSTSCYITVNNDDIFTANYHEGTITHLKLIENKLVFIKNLLIEEGCGCHQVIITGENFIIPCLITDEIIYLDKNFNKISKIKLPNGSGPRHGVISSDSKYLYIACELSGFLYKISLLDGNFDIQHKISLFNSSKRDGAAAIRLSSDMGKLYVSVRNEDIIVLVDIKNDLPVIIANYSVNGSHPRDILNILEDKYILSANRTTNEIVCLSRQCDGNYEFLDKKAVPEVVCISII